MKTRYLLFVVVVLTAVTVHAQQNYQQGYVVTVNGDTIKGQVNNLIWQESPVSVTIDGPNGKAFYTPEQVLAFSAGNHTQYRSFKVRVDTTGGTGGTRPTNPTPSFVEQHVFLRVILSGNTSLLKLRQGFRTHFFIQKQGEIPEELITHTSERIIGGQTLVQPGTQFIAQLQNKMSDCPQVQVNTDMKYLEPSFIDLFTKYNQCKSSGVYLPGNEPAHNYMGVAAAGHFDQFAKGFKGGAGYTAGVFFEKFFARGVYKTSWYTELAYYRYATQTITTRNFSTTGLNESYRFEVGTVKLTSMIKSKILDAKSRPYILGGVGKVFSSQNSKVYVNDALQSGSIKGSIDALLGFGMYVTRDLSAELRAQKTLLITFEAANHYNSANGLGGGCFSVALSLAYHISLSK